MKKLTLYFMFLLVLPTGLLAQYTGANGRGDILVTVNGSFLNGEDKLYTGGFGRGDFELGCISPANGGSIAEDQEGCSPFDPALITSTVPTGQTGTLEYKWQKSITSSSAGFEDIASSNSETYDPLATTQTTWYKRLARVSCQADWTGATVSNVVQMTVNLLPTLTGVSQASTVCEGSGATINLTGLLAGSTSAVVYDINGILQSTVGGVVADGSGSASFTTRVLTASDNGLPLQIRVITNTGVTPNCESLFYANELMRILISVDPASAGGTVASAQTICADILPADLLLSGKTGNVVKWQRSLTEDFASPTDIPETSTTLSGVTIGILSADTWFRAVVINGVCSAANSASVKITVNPAPSAEASVVSNVSCYGCNNGSVSVIASGGTIDYTYAWSTSPVQTGSTATGLTAGTYTVTVTDAANCAAMASATLTQPEVPITANASVVSHVSCFGGSNGSLTVSASGGDPSYSYLWSTIPSQTAQTATGLIVGTYTVTVTDGVGATITSSATVSQPAAALEATASVVTHVDCYGNSNGSVTTTVNGGTENYSYAWSTNPVQNTQSATGLSAGIYSVTVTDAHSCTVSSSAMVTQPDEALTAIASVVSHVSIYLGSDGTVTVTPAGGTTPYSFNWSTSPLQTSQSATGLTAGTYFVTVTDAHSCTAISSATVTQPTPPANQATDIVFTDIGSSQMKLDWTRGDGDGCAVFVLQGSTGTAPAVNNTAYPPDPVFGNPASQVGTSGWYCVYDGTGTSVTVTGLTPSYVYRVHICEYKTGSKTYNTGSVANNPNNNSTFSEFLANASVVSHVSCFGGSNGSLTVSASGGNPSYSYLWSTIPSQTAQTATGLIAGTYTVTVTDGVGATITSSATVSQPAAALEATALVVTHVDCYGNSNGEITATVSGGTEDYSYAWSTNPVQNTQSATGLTSGTYWVTVTDAHSCTATSSTTVTQPALALEATASVVTHVDCYENSNGEVTASAAGGTMNYSYTWSTNPVQNSQSATGLTSGTYWVTVTDAHSCKATSSATVTQPSAALEATASVVTNIDCHGNNNGEVTVTASGGTTNYSYTWSTDPVQNSQSATGLTSGTYWVTVTDAHSCTATSSATVTQPATALEATASVVTHVDCYGNNNGEVTATVSGGTEDYSYAWSTNPVQNTQSATGLTSGTYWVTVTDAHSCTATSSATVTQPDLALEATASVVTHVDCYGNNNGEVTVTTSGGTEDYSYTWSTNPVQNSQSATGLTSGTYWVTVTDAHSCIATSSATVTQPELLEANASVIQHVTCYNGSDGSVTATVSGGTENYSYAWSTNPVQNTQSATGLTAGTYHVTVTDAHSCTAISSATVTQPPQWWPTASGSSPICKFATGTYTTETGMSNYSWTVSAGGSITSGGTSTDHSVTVLWSSSGAQTVSVNYTTPAGCTAVVAGVKPVTVHPVPTPVISGATVVPDGTTVDYSTPYVAGHTYSWSVNIGNAQFCDNTRSCLRVKWYNPCGLIGPGVVSVTETDVATGCSTTATVYVTFTP